MAPPSSSESTAVAHSLLSKIIQNLGVEIVFVVVTVTFVLTLRGMRHRALGPAKRVEGAPCRAERPLLSSRSAPTACTTKLAAERTAVHALGVRKGVAASLANTVDQAIATRLSTAKTLAYYDELKQEGKHKTLGADLAAAGSKHTALDFFVALVQCAGRAGRPQLVEELLDDMEEVGVERPLKLYESAMRLLAGKRSFKEAISVYDRLEKDGLQPSPTSLSCLVGFASELGELDRAVYFFEQLSAQEAPSIRACMSVLRVYAKRKDWTSSVKLLNSLKERNVHIDSIVLNIVMATGIAVGEVAGAEAMLGEEPGSTVADVVSYNIVMKGWAQLGKVDRTLGLLNKMVERGKEPNLITFNTAMDSAVRAQRSDDMWRLYSLMVKESNLKPDKCTCSTLVKGLYQNHDETKERLVSILELIEDVIYECSGVLLNSLFSGVLEASCRMSDAALAMRAFKRMCQSGVALTAPEIRSLALTAAKAGDVAGCQMVWGTAGAVQELVPLKAAVDRLVQMGCSIDSATLQCQPASEGQSKQIGGLVSTFSGTSSEVQSAGGRRVSRPARRHVGSAMTFVNLANSKTTSGLEPR